MNEKHIAYKISQTSPDLVCTYSEFEEDNMLDLLKEIEEEHSEGIFWIFKQRNNKPKEQLCIIDCAAHRIYFHHSGEVDQIQNVINKLSQKSS